MGGETRIHVLGDHVINKIAAGEVVDRPASVVKELMENSLDAGATRLEVEVVAGGRNLIAVSDNGRGMSRDDALLSIERHATSKIRDVDDIERIETLGFRGEALAAIASVSRFTLQTAEAGATEGAEVHVQGGRIADVKPAGVPVGTRITVRNLFFNVPARRRFLRSDATELSHIRQVVMLYALSHPEAGLRFVVDGREMLNLASGGTPRERLFELYERPVVESLRPVSHEHGGVRLTGYVGVPQLSRTDRAEQYVFVNRRPAGAPLVQFAINEAYQTLLPRGRYPMVFLFLDLDPCDVDVNVHPTKKEVRFRQPGAVRDTLVEGIRRALTQEAGDGAGADAPAAPVPPPPPQPVLSIPDLPETRVFAYPRIAGASLVPGAGSPAAFPTSTGNASAGSAPEEGAGRRSPWGWCRIIGQVGGLFVVLETEDGLVLMDPHAAHERVLFEKLLREVTGHKVRSQGLLMPETVPLRTHDAEVVRRNLPLLREMGFLLSDFGGDTFMVEAVPAVLGLFSAKDLLAEIALTLDQGGPRGGTERWAWEQVATAACRAAVKARDRLTMQEIERLVIDLASADMPYTCPHGRPTLIHFSFHELNRKFGRE